jgi:hypothetical protein
VIRVTAGLVDAVLAVWLVAFVAWHTGRRAGRYAAARLVDVVEQMTAHGSAVLVVIAPAVLLWLAVVR